MTTILLGEGRGTARKFAPLRPACVRSPRGFGRCFARAGRDTLWISFGETWTRGLLRSIGRPMRSLGSMLLLHRPSLDSLAALEGHFDRVCFNSNGGFLPVDELAAVLAAENRGDLFIGGTVSPQSRTITLWRGDLAPLTVPFSAFEPSGDGTKPEFSSFAVTDHGNTIRLGEYEAAADAILYEFDAEYRRRKAKERLARDRSFGASLRRLRKQRRLRREDFPPLSQKTIARIERGDVKDVRERTLRIIAKTLSVDPGDIGSY